MNRVIFVSLALCLLVAPALSLPADNKSEKLEDFSGENPVKQNEIPVKHPDENEVSGSVPHDVEEVEKDSGDETAADDDKTSIATSSVNGQIQGIIVRQGFKGDKFRCRNVDCKEGTEKCIFNSTMIENGNTLDVHYYCYDANGTLLETKTEHEKIEDISTSFGHFNFFPDMNDMFKRMETFMQSMFPKAWGFDNDEDDE